MLVKKILIVEDDYLQAIRLKEVMESQFPQARLQLMTSEFEFVDGFPELEREPPDIVIIDVMLRWTHPSPDMHPAPKGIRREGHFRAGLRCERLLRESKSTREIPVILYTVFDEKDLESEVEAFSQRTRLLSKREDTEILLDTVRGFLTK